MTSTFNKKMSTYSNGVWITLNCFSCHARQKKPRKLQN